MADEIFKSRHAFGSSGGVSNALDAGTIDAYDILFLDGDTAQPKMGWVTRNNEIVILENKDQVVPVASLPSTGETGVLYICDEVGYIWNGEDFVPITQSTDVSGLETRIDSMETELATKVTEEQVSAMIAEVAGLEIVEF